MMCHLVLTFISLSGLFSAVTGSDFPEFLDQNNDYYDLLPYDDFWNCDTTENFGSYTLDMDAPIDYQFTTNVDLNKNNSIPDNPDVCSTTFTNSETDPIAPVDLNTPQTQLPQGKRALDVQDHEHNRPDAVKKRKLFHAFKFNDQTDLVLKKQHVLKEAPSHPVWSSKHQLLTTDISERARGRFIEYKPANNSQRMTLPNIPKTQRLNSAPKTDRAPTAANEFGSGHSQKPSNGQTDDMPDPLLSQNAGLVPNQAKSSPQIPRPRKQNNLNGKPSKPALKFHNFNKDSMNRKSMNMKGDIGQDPVLMKKFVFIPHHEKSVPHIPSTAKEDKSTETASNVVKNTPFSPLSAASDSTSSPTTNTTMVATSDWNMGTAKAATTTLNQRIDNLDFNQNYFYQEANQNFVTSPSYYGQSQHHQPQQLDNYFHSQDEDMDFPFISDGMMYGTNLWG